jgi:catechol 2,3-dioxygenase-like lactoylglutathione lyase family enzyme
MTKLPDPNFILLYVKDVATSVSFYTGLLGRAPIDASPNFGMFALSSGVLLGLWARHDVEPAATAPTGSGEIGITLASVGEVEAAHADWLGRGLSILQPPTKMDFGFTFVAGDPDGNRLRVFCPAGA